MIRVPLNMTFSPVCCAPEIDERNGHTSIMVDGGAHAQ
jgi:hypothetical protein